jgi:hypothetical protein
VLSACGDLTRIAVTCACILTSQRSSMARAFAFIADGNALLPRALAEANAHPQFRYYVLAPIIFGAKSLDE